MNKLIHILSKPTICFALIALIYLLGFFGHALYLKKTVYGDGIFYYSWLRSVVIDHDISFINEYNFFDVTQPHTQSGILSNKYAIGPALLWAPSFLWIHGLIHGNGYEFPYQLTIGLTSVGYAIIGLYLLYLFLQKYFEKQASILTIIALAFGTNLLFYGSIDTVNSHSLSFFAICVFLALLFPLITTNQKSQTYASWFSIGVSLGLIGIIRPQDSILTLLLIPFIFTLSTMHVHRSYSNYKQILLFLLGWSIPQLFQQFVFWQLYGQFLFSPYLAGGETFSFFKPHIGEVLFAFTYGFFTVTPLICFTIPGFFFPWGKLEHWKKIIAGIVLLAIYLVASWSTWTQGASYGGRMLISTLPLLSIPLAAGISYVFKKFWQGKLIFTLTIAMFSILNLCRIITFLLLSP